MRTQFTRRNRTACSILALATALAVGPSPAAAQSFLGSGSPLVAGSATITTPNGSTTNIAVNNPQTVITWTPTDTATSTAPIVFQPGGTTANFIMGGNNYAVLNRIIATDQTRQIQFFGTVNSNVGATTGPTGGSIYFYAPGGFLLGGGSIFNVGSLVLSASPIQFDANGTFITGPRNEVIFGQATQPGATVTTNPDSQINALNTDSYVAFVAPRIIRTGDIAVDGQAAMVAAEAATIRFAPDGLFDIEVTSGTSQANGMTGGGAITGEASAGAGDHNRIYMVAVPKNQAMTLALSQGSNLGFEVAGAADVVGNTIILSAGHDIVGGQIQSARSAGGGTGSSSISIHGTNATSALTARATGAIDLFNTAGLNTTFAGDVSLTSPVETTIGADGAAASLTFDRDVMLDASAGAAAEGANATGGIAEIFAINTAAVQITGNATLMANATGGASGTAGITSGSGTGGQVWLSVFEGGYLNILGNVTGQAMGAGGEVLAAGVDGGNGTGGSVRFFTSGDQFLAVLDDPGGTLNIGGDVVMNVNGLGASGAGVECNLCDGLSGNGQGGLVWLSAQAGVESAVTVQGNVNISGIGTGGDGRTQRGGSGQGGNLQFFYGNGAALTVNGYVSMDASGYGGDSVTGGGGDGTGGYNYIWRSNADLTSGTMYVGGILVASANGRGGYSDSGVGGIGRGGFSGIYTNVGSMLFDNSVMLYADGQGGNSGSGTGGAGYGGVPGQFNGGTTVFAGTNGDITIDGSYYSSAIGQGGYSAEGNGGFGQGGEVEVVAANGGDLTFNNGVTLDASGRGGDGAGAGAVSGNGQGGSATIIAAATGSLTIAGFANVFADGYGGVDWDDLAASGDGLGGTALVSALSGGSVSVTGLTSVRANGNGGQVSEGLSGGPAGDGRGGTARIEASGVESSVSLAGTTVEARGYGSMGWTSAGGDAYGGAAEVAALAGGAISVTGNLDVDAEAFGGFDSAGFGGGNAFGGGDQDEGGASLSASGTGSSVTVTGLTRITSDAMAGTGAVGRGGRSSLLADSGGSVSLNQLNLRADGFGGDATASVGAGSGFGGTATLDASGTGTSISVANSILTGGTLQDRELLSADGFGGVTTIAGGTGGNGTGGTVNLRSAAGATVSLVPANTNTSGLLLRARGYGGDPNAEGATGGIGDGGTLNLVVDGGTMTTGYLQYSSIGQGGFTILGGLNTNGGDGIGGERHISVTNGGTLTTAIVGGIAGGVGGFGTGSGSGGDASGGIATLTMNNGTLNLAAGQSTVVSQMSGGEALGTGNGGDALGGNVTSVNISNGSIVNVAAGATLGFDASSFGGNADGAGTGGDAVAGNVFVNISDSTVNGGLMRLSAVGQAGDSIGGTAGNGAGGDAFLTLDDATVAVAELTVRAAGTGGWTQTGTAGSGTGGHALLIASGGLSTVTATTAVNLSGDGLGGGIYDATGIRTGDGFGGDASIYVATGAALTINSNTNISAVGDGGELFDSETVGTPAGSGGSGDGGVASVFADTGTLTFNGNLAIDASALGRSGINGTGGNALGGTAAVGTVGGNVTVNGTLSLDGSATGGNGTTGGNATALVSNAEETDPTAVSLYVQGGGNITVTGATTINAGATGGSGSSGPGGNATAGETDIVAYIGDITLAGLTLNGNAIGGNGGLGGAGGFGTGGMVDIAFGLGDAAVDGVITIGDLSASVDGDGGDGGAGAAESAGGNGGTGTGGFIYFVGSAAGGSLQTGTAFLSATGAGGAGGTGGVSGNAVGGAGGTGGNGIGGEIFAGTLSNSGAGGSGGDFDVGNLWIDTSAIGGDGGAGGFGGAGNGAGGNGGNAWGGGSYLLIRGVNASADAVTLIANAEGGDGGTGSVQGNGGNATTGLIQVESKDRFGFPGQRGNLVADSISAVAVATGGTGTANGTSTVFGGNYFRVLNGDATIGSVSFTIAGDLYDDSYYSDYVSVRDGTATIGSFSYSTTQALALDAGNGTMDAGTITLSAGTFRANRPDVPAPTVAGTYQATDFSITTGGDFVTIANLSSDTDLSIIAPGEINMADAYAGDTLTLDAQGGALTAGSLTSGVLNLSALSQVSLGDLSGGSMQIDSTNAGVTFGEVLAGGNMLVTAFNGAVAGGNIAIGGTLTVDADSITVGDIVGDIAANDGVSLFAGSSITTGNVLSDGNVSMSAFGFTSTIDVGNIDAGGYIELIAATILGGNLSADSYISLNAGGLDTIDVGDLTGNGVYATSLGNIFTGNIVSLADVFLESFEGGISTGNITAATTVDLEAAGDVSFGNVNAAELSFESGGAVQGGNIVATSQVGGEAQGTLVLGDISVSGPPNEGDFSVGLSSATSIQVGNVSAFDKAGFATTGDLTTGNIFAGNLIMALVSGDVVTGALTTGSSGQVYIGDSSMFTAAGGPDNFDETIVLGQAPVATGGSLTVNGAIDTPVFRVAIGDAFAIGDISVEGAFAVEASSITTGDITATSFIALTSPGAIVTGDLIAGTSVTLTGASVTTGNIVAGVGAPTAAEDITVMNVGPGESVEILSDSSIVTGNITTDGYVGLYAADDITAGSINAEHDVIALAGGDASFGPITTPERFILAGYANFAALNDGETFDPELIFQLEPASTGGDAFFAGTTAVGDFEAWVGGNTVVASLTSQSQFFGGDIRIDSGGTIGISGLINASYIDFVSSNINIAPTATINASIGITFNSTNSVGTYIGDNLSGTDGYRLTQAEIDRVNAPFYGFDVLPGRGAAEMMMIGDLTLELSASEFGEGADFEIESDEGEIDDELRGIIRIVGDVNLTSSEDTTVYFTAETIAIDAATGSLSLTNGSGGLNGLISFEANNIFVASGAIIDQLLVDPRYPGHVADLNAPAAVQRPEGVLRAGAIDFDDEASLQNLLIQNTGTASTPAGFLVLAESEYSDGEFDGGDDEDEFPPPGSVNLVINGQLQTPTGNLTGAAVRDALVEDYGTVEPFTDNSTINGCPVSGGSCGNTTGGPLPPEAVITPTQVAILTTDPIGESVFGNEGDIAGETGGDEGGEDGGSASSPIDAPQPLFDTRPLNSDEDVNEPISGAGNPSLYGISSDEDDEDEEEEGEGKKEGEAKPASKSNARTGDGQ